MKPMIFHVEAAGDFRPVEIAFATESEVRRMRVWRKMAPKSDAGEFAALAAKRWFYYSREGAAVASLKSLRAAVKRNEHAELAFLLIASAAWAKRYKFLALAYCRRTWCHHLALDFLAVRPRLTFANQPISGIGTGMLFCLTELAASLGMEMIWGEATASSAAFYEKILQTRPWKTCSLFDGTPCVRSKITILRTGSAGLKKSNKGCTMFNMRRKLTPREWMDDLLEYERTHEIAFASPRALLEARLIAELDKGRSHRRNHRNAASHRRKVTAR